MVRDDDGWKRKSGAAQALRHREDILFQILTRLRAKSLIRFKLACKSWMAFISDHFFVNSHSHRSKSYPLEIVTMRIYPLEMVTMGVLSDSVVLMDGKGRHKSCFPLSLTEDRNLRFTPNPVIVHSDGVFLIGRTARRLMVCNPATREVVELPPVTYMIPKAEDSEVGIGLDRSTNKYKVVRIFYQRKDSNRQQLLYGMEMITLGAAGNSWRQKAYPPYDISGDLLADIATVTVQGAVYWRIERCHNDNNNSTSHFAILRFDLSNEEFTVIDPPDSNKFGRLVELHGHLYCYAQDALNEDDRTIWVWLLNDNLVGWTLRYTIHHQDPSRPHFTPIAINQEGCLLLQSDPRHLHCYNPRTNQFYGIGDTYPPEIKDFSYFCCHTTAYVETIMPISCDR